jgi:hypothetical protein
MGNSNPNPGATLHALFHHSRRVRCPSMTEPVHAGVPFAPIAEPRPAHGASPRPARNQASLGQRIAGALMIINAALLLAQASVAPILPDIGGPRPSMLLGSALFDAVIGLSLLLGYRKLAALAILRVALGLVVLTALYIKSDPLVAVFQVVASTGLLLLLTGEAKRARVLIGSIVFGLYLMMASTSLVFVTIGRLSLATMVLKATGAIEPLPNRTVSGTSIGYSLTVPDDRWFMRKDALAKKDNPLAD